MHFIWIIPIAYGYKYYTNTKMECCMIMILQIDKTSDFDIFDVFWAYFTICVAVQVWKWSIFWLGKLGHSFRIISIIFQSFDTAVT